MEKLASMWMSRDEAEAVSAVVRGLGISVEAENDVPDRIRSLSNRVKFGFLANGGGIPEGLLVTIKQVLAARHPAGVRQPCPRCKGTGTYRWGSVFDGVPMYRGSCYQCNGSGWVSVAARNVEVQFGCLPVGTRYKDSAGRPHTKELEDSGYYHGEGTHGRVSESPERWVSVKISWKPRVTKDGN